MTHPLTTRPYSLHVLIHHDVGVEFLLVFHLRGVVCGVVGTGRRGVRPSCSSSSGQRALTPNPDARRAPGLSSGQRGQSGGVNAASLGPQMFSLSAPGEPGHTRSLLYGAERETVPGNHGRGLDRRAGAEAHPAAPNKTPDHITESGQPLRPQSR